MGGDYEALMCAADERGVAIGIQAGDLMGPKGNQYRPMTALTAERGGTAVREKVVSGDLHAAARRLRARLP